MKLINIDDGNMFIAMEYYALILNRTLLIIAGHDAIVGLKVRGLTSAGRPGGLMTVGGNLDNPRSYISPRKLAIYEGRSLTPEFVRAASSANFWIGYDQIGRVYHDPKKKWGMSYYPHNGKVYVETKDKRKEFIILGDQSGDEISNMLRAKAGLVK